MIGLRRLGFLVVVLGAIWAVPAHAATWCGTPSADVRTPDLVGGSSVHVVYVAPSDVVDRFPNLASGIETDVENIDTWWRGQDPTRTPRFDVYPFPCGPQADMLDRRLTIPASQLTTESAIFTAIENDLLPLGLIRFTNTTLVYYDGPTFDPDICGFASPFTDGGGVAIVLLNSCSGVAIDWVAAHEITHVFGAVAVGAPHRCSDSAHTCDSASDLMYPYTSGNPLSSAILDPGRDDYYGHSGAWTDVQDSQYLRHLDNQQRLSLTITGAGSVASAPQGVSCTASCNTDWDGGTVIALNPNPADGMRFVRWTGGCTGDDCSLTLNGPSSVNAFFAPETYKLTASVTGKGTIRSNPSGIACKPRCGAAFTSYEPVRLTAKPLKGWKLKAWGGACKGHKLTCSVPMSKAASARAVFVKKPKQR